MRKTSPCPQLLRCALLLLLLCGNAAFGQIVSGNLFLQGRYLEGGFQPTGAMGSGTNAPSGYHPHGTASMCGATTPLASVYDWGHDGWATGTPAYMGDYTLPGSPYEEWVIQVGDSVMHVSSLSCSLPSGLSGSFTSYTNTGGRAVGVWTGSAASGALTIKTTQTIDTLGSAIVFNVTLVNNSAATLSSIYYGRALDPDNDETWSYGSGSTTGSFSTLNGISFQNDAEHRVMVTAVSTATGVVADYDSVTGYPATSIALAAKDARAKAIVLNAWPLSTGCTVRNLWADSASCGTTDVYDTTSTFVSGDASIGLFFKIDSIGAHDSTSFSLAYIYNGTTGIDSALGLTPQLVVDSLSAASPDTITACNFSGLTTIPVSIVYSPAGTTWSWAPSTGLSGTTGTSQTINRSAISGVTTYTITGTDSGSANTYLYITVYPNTTVAAISGASSVCLGYSTTLTDSYSGGTWSSSNTSVATVNSSGTVTSVSTGVDTIYYSVPCATRVFKVINVTRASHSDVINGPTGVCVGANITLTDTISGGVWSTSNPTIASVNTAGVVSGVSAGTAIISYSVSGSCGAATVFTTITVSPAPAAPSGISGPTTVCAGATITLSDSTAGGTWTSGNVSVATVSSGGVVMGLTSGTAVITYSISNSCGTSYAISTITVTGAPTAGTISGASTVCVGSSTALSDGVSGGVWSSSNTAVATVNVSTGNVYGVSAGSVTISYTVTNTCGSNTATKAMTVTSGPTAPPAIGGPTSVCAGSTITLTDGTTGGTWSSGTISVATISASGVVTGVSAGRSSITYTISNSCGTSSVSTVVTVNGATTVGTISGTSSVCAGSTTTLTDGTSGGTWSSSNTSVATVNASGSVSGVAAGSATISYTVTGTCGNATATFAVTVISVPVVGAITGTSTLCTGTSSTLSDATTGGTWSSGSTTVATVNSAGTVYGVAAGTATITYSVTNSCGTSVATKSVTVNTLPSAGTISGAGTLCTGTTTTLVDGTTGGNWTSSNTTVATVSSAGLVSGVSAGSATITYTVTGSCGTATATYAVTVNPTANAGTITGVTTLCAGSTANMTETAGGGTWSSSAPAIATINSAGVVTGVASGTVVMSYSVTTTCGTAVATHSMTINPLPAAGTISGTSTLCAGNTVTLSDAVSGGTWSSSNTAIATVSAAGVVGGVAAGTAAISYSVTNSCGTATAGMVVNVGGAPTAGTITGSSVVCTGATITLSDATAGGTWSSSSTAKATVSSTGVVTGVGAGAVTISYTVVSSCATVSATLALTVSTSASAGTISGLATVCTGANITLTSTGTAGGAWSSSNPGVATVAGGVVHGLTAGVTTISYAVTTSCGTVVATKSITVNATPTVTAITGSTNICIGSSSVYTDGTTGGGWISSNTAIATVNSAGVVTGISAGTITLTYFVTNTCGSATTSKSVTVNSLTAGVISGAASIAVGASTTLTNTVSGGVWSSAHTAIATIGTTGSVTGVAVGTDSIKYSVTNVCGTANAYKVISVTAHRDAPGASGNGEGTLGVSLYPNPNSGTFTLELTGTTGTATVIVTDLNGKTLFTTTSNDQKIGFDMSNYAAGTYLLSVSVDGEVVTKKVIIK